MGKSPVAQEVETHIRHVLLEGWTQIWHTVYATEEGSFVLVLEYLDDDDKNRAGQNWVVTEENLEDIRFLMYELAIPSLNRDGSRPGREEA